MSQYALGFTLGFQNGSGTNMRHGVGSGAADRDLESPFYPGVATLKHWDANSLEKSDGFTRHTYDANVSLYSLQVRYLAHLYLATFSFSHPPSPSALQSLPCNVCLTSSTMELHTVQMLYLLLLTCNLYLATSAGRVFQGVPDCDSAR